MREPQKFRKRPVVIEAMQWDGTSEGATPILHWVHSHGERIKYRCNREWSCSGREEDHHLIIDTLEGQMRADPGDWVIRGVQGEFYSCKPSIFATTYDQEPA